MKKFLLLFAVFAAFNLSAQVLNFSDDFENYKPGDFVAKTNKTWTTWSNTPGTPEDTQISDEKAKSGKLSAKFSSTATGGGPTDLILPFFGSLTKTNTSGTFENTMYFYVPNGKTAYFNYQAVNPVGKTWALDVYFDADGTFSVISSGAGGTQGTAKFANDTWVKYSCVIDLTTNKWVISLDDKAVAEFSTSNNSLFAMDIYPADANALFYIDDVSTKYTPFTPKSLDAALTQITMKSRAFAGKVYNVTGSARNLGKDTIKTLEYTWTDGVTTYTEALKNLNVLPLATLTLTPSDTYTANAKANNLNFTITKVNGKADDDVTNNKKNFAVTIVTPALDKKVVAEEATGTWCQWCPRGHVMMNMMAKEYPDHFVGVAVHGGSSTEPMGLPDYVSAVVGTGYPSAKVERNFTGDPSAIEDEFFKAITSVPTGKITPKVTYDKAKKEMAVEVSVTFSKAAEAQKGSYNIVCVVVEDSIKGTTAAYNQANAYAGGASGVMGGYEKLANPVPAAKMVYNHTARALLSSVDGDEIAVDPKAGTTAKLNYKYTVPATFKEKYLEVVAILINPDTKAGNAEIAVAKNFKTTATNDLSEHEAFQNIYPNPTNDKTYIQLNIKDLAEVSIEVTDINGRVVAARNFGNVQGDNIFPYDSSDLSAGVYFVRIHIGKDVVTKKLIKE